jgi:DNA-binding transcriptional LysR family regulator
MADRLDLRDLRYFEAIADAGHVGRAAQSLHRTQPALTGAIRRLEERLGTRLFEKAGRGIRLSAAGAALHARARSLRIAAEEVEREVGEIGRGEVGLVRLGLVPTAARLLMPPLCRQFLASAPGISFRSVIANNDVLRTALKAGDVDVTVSFATAGDEDIASHVVFADECVVVASRRHPVFRTRPTLRGLLPYGWLLAGPGVATREWLEHAFRARGLPGPRVQVESNQVLTLTELVGESELLAFMSRRQLALGTGLREVPLRETTMRRKFTVGYRKKSYLSPATRRVIDALQSGARKLLNPP